jgi:hypothetical protein
VRAHQPRQHRREPVKLDAFLRGLDGGRALYFADETGGEPAATAFAPGAATLLTGPEGGFTPDEAAAIRAAPGAKAISLGPRILRAIESRDDLLSVFAGGEKPRERWRIGTEHEKFVYRSPTIARRRGTSPAASATC